MKVNELKLFGVLLIALLSVTQLFLAHNTLYTEGEVIQGLYSTLVCINFPILLVVLWRPKQGLWIALSLGMILVPWQAYRNQKLVKIHEEVVEIIRFVEGHKGPTNQYPKNLDNYKFKRGNVRYQASDSEFRLDYFMDDPGTGYWYKSESGFGYYPD